MSEYDIHYDAPKTCAKFIRSDAQIKIIVGPVGSGKSTSSLMNIIKVATDQKPQKDGIKRTRVICVRNTRKQLQDTVISPFLEWFKDGIYGTFHKTEDEFLLNPPGSDIECQVWFRALDTPEDRRKLLSMQTTAIFFEEIREINPHIFEDAFGRCGRYPFAKDGGAVRMDGSPNKCIFGATNPPIEGTYWGNILINPQENMEVFWQPSGLSPEAENVPNLPKNYYQDLCFGKNQDWINVYVHGKLGQSMGGKPVFPGFNAEYHIAKEPLVPGKSSNYPLIIGMDFGLNPSVVIGQMNPKGQILIYDELTSDGMGILRFIQNSFKPLLSQKYSNFKTIIYGDPSGVNRSQTDERTVFDILRNNSLPAKPAFSNAIPLRLASVDGLLMKQIDGEPALLIDPGCKNLIAGFRGGYKYKTNEKKNDMIENDEPEKNQFSHCQDALQYLCMHFNNPVLSVDTRRKARQIKMVDSTGWTC